MRLNHYNVKFTVEGRTKPGRKPGDDPVLIEFNRGWIDKSKAVITEERLQARFGPEYGGGKLTVLDITCTKAHR